MMEDLYSQLFKLPSGRHFLSGILNDLSRRCSVVTLLPAGVEPAVLTNVIREELRRLDYYQVEIFLPDLSSDYSPAVSLSAALELKWEKDDTSRTVANMVLSQNLPDIIFFKGFDAIPEGQRRKWMSFLVDWSKASQYAADNGSYPAACCLFIPAAKLPMQLPVGNVYLSVHWWWGFPTALEIQLLCRFGDWNQVESDNDIGPWREYVLSSLVGNDIFLAEYLWNKMEDCVDNLINYLEDYATQRGWTQEEFELLGVDRISFSANKNQRFTTPNLLEWNNLWARGMLSWTPEYGLELHAAALVVLGRKSELWHRIWRGQSKLLLPLLDGIRLKICDSLTRSYGFNWPVRWFAPIYQEEEMAVKKSPLACQWGHLEYLLNNCQNLRSERRWLSVIKPARRIRNELAHYRPISFDDFRQLYYEWQKLNSQLVY